MKKEKKKGYTARRNTSIEVVLNEEEKQKIIKLANNEGLPISTFIRWKLLKETQ